MTTQVKEGLILVGVIGAARGLKGDLRVKSYTSDPRSIGAYGALTDAAGTKTFTVKVVGMHKDMVLARIKGVDDRNAADALKGQTLYMERDHLPVADEDEFYFSDLIGVQVQLSDGTLFGHVVEADDVGGGPFLEVASLNFGRVLVPFTKACVPDVNIAGNKIVIDPPEGLLEPGDPGPQEEAK